jgi:hypothetical protein
MFCNLVDPTKYRFTFRGKVSTNKWNELLEMGILLYRRQTNFVCKLHKEGPKRRGHDTSRRQLDLKVSDYVVHSAQSIMALMDLCSALADRSIETDGSVPAAAIVDQCEKYTVYFETVVAIPEQHHELIDRLAGGEAYIRTCPGTTDETQGYTITGSFDLLRRALQPLLESDDDDESMHTTISKPKRPPCVLRIDNPTPDTLCRFVNACQLAQDYPKTLGVDVMSNRYFCKKSIADVMSILVYMSDYGRSASVSGDFIVHQLSSEQHPF